MKLNEEDSKQLIANIINTFDDLKILFKNKNANYGCSIFTTEPLCPTVSPVTAIKVRINDKINRLVTLMAHCGEDSVGESIADTLYDLAVYSIILGNLYEYSSKFESE